MSKLQIFGKSLSAAFSHPVVTVIEQAAKPNPKVHAIAKATPEWLMDNYRRFVPCYRNGLEVNEAKLVNVVYSEELDLHVAWYTIYRQYAGNEYYIWLWHEGAFHEVEQRDVRGVREIDLRAMKQMNPWLY